MLYAIVMGQIKSTTWGTIAAILTKLIQIWERNSGKCKGLFLGTIVYSEDSAVDDHVVTCEGWDESTLLCRCRASQRDYWRVARDGRRWSPVYGLDRLDCRNVILCRVSPLSHASLTLRNGTSCHLCTPFYRASKKFIIHTVRRNLACIQSGLQYHRSASRSPMGSTPSQIAW